MVRIPGSKTAVPALPPDLVPRPALATALDREPPAQLVALIAPAGYGKTLLLADLVRRSRTPTAWVSLDHEDDAPRLLSAVLAALTALPGVPADGPLARLADVPHGRGGEIVDDLTDDLTEALDTLAPPARLVLDDVHELTAPDALRLLARLVRSHPAGLRLVLAGRADPPLGLPRLRLEGRLFELRAEQLRFTVGEACALLRGGALHLAPEQVTLLHQRTGGWPAGLRLAAAALRRTDDVDAFLTDFSGDERSVADYLTGEILSGMPDETREFLHTVSICSPLPAGLAVALSGRPDAARLLDGLRRDTALVERTGHGEHLIHPLLRSYLVAGLDRHRPALHRRLHGVAAQWWADAGRPRHALRHGERAGDDPLLAGLLRRCGVPLLLSGQHDSVRHGLAAVGTSHRAADPWLALTAALTHLDERALPAAAAELRQARRVWPERHEPGLDALRTSAELIGAGLGLFDGQLIDGPDPATVEPALEALLRLSRTAAELCSARRDAALPRADPARADLERAVALARIHDFAYLEVQGLSLLATLAATRGDHRAMAGAAREAVAAASRHGRHPSRWSAAASAMLAYADLLAGDPTAARARAAEALAPAERLPPEAAWALRAVHGAARADQGERAAGLAETRAARAQFGHSPVSPVLWPMPAALAVLEHRAALLQGNAAAAADVATWLATQVGEVGEVLLLHALAQAAAGRHEAARTTVAPLRAAAVPLLLPHTPLEVHLIDAEAAFQAGDREAGLAALDEALAGGAALDVVRPLVLAGPRTREALPGRPAARATGPFAAALAAARTTVRAEPAALLSERELVVLALLPSLLSSGEIAAELTVSVNTVKSHIRSIYAKLEVSTRRDAVRRAHERGLL